MTLQNILHIIETLVFYVSLVCFDGQENVGLTGEIQYLVQEILTL